MSFAMPTLISLATLQRNHKEHEEHKVNNIVMGISFVILVYFVVKDQQWVSGREIVSSQQTVNVKNCER